MFDHIVQESPFLPTGVALTALYRDAGAEAIRELSLLSSEQVRSALGRGLWSCVDQWNAARSYHSWPTLPGSVFLY